jgi:hypothetical protein
MRHVDKQPIDVAERHRLEMHADRFERPTPDQLGGGFQHRPEVPDEVELADWRSRTPASPDFYSQTFGELETSLP